jgi:hypothetical protein
MKTDLILEMHAWVREMQENGKEQLLLKTKLCEELLESKQKYLKHNTGLRKK